MQTQYLTEPEVPHVPPYDAEQMAQGLAEQGEDALVIWDRSEWEQPESLALEGLCAVRSSKAKRLTHIKPGYYNPPGRPIFVPGMHWLAAIVVGRSAQLGPPLLAAMRWWSSRGANASFTRDEEGKLLLERRLRWGRSVGAWQCACSPGDASRPSRHPPVARGLPSQGSHPLVSVDR